MLQLVIGIIAGIGIDSGITLYAVHRIRQSQEDMAKEAVDKLSDGIISLAPQILAEVMKQNDKSNN